MRKRIYEIQKPILSEGLNDKCISSCGSSESSTSEVDEDNGEVNSSKRCSTSSKERGLTVEFLEDETDAFQGVDDWDGTIFVHHGSSFLLLHPILLLICII